ncbi:MAG: hypothetical protein ACYTG0_12485 [Planctomycetota bacterium]
MSVPEDAASGKAKVTLSFPSLKEARIAPATFEITLVDVSPEEEAEAEREQQKAEEQSRRRIRVAFPHVEIEALRKQLEQEDDREKREQIQSLIRAMEKLLEDVDEP